MDYGMRVMFFVVGVIVFGLGAWVGSLSTIINLRKAFLFSVRNNTDYFVDVQIDYNSKEIVVVDVVKEPKKKTKRTK